MTPFAENVASQFLLSLLGKSGIVCDKERDAALKICQTVENHPLTLDLIGCYIRRCGISLMRFAHDYPDFDRNLIFQNNQFTWKGNQYQSFVNGAMSMNLGSVLCGEGMDPSSELLIRMLSLLDEDGVPRILFTGHSEEKM